MASTRNKNTQGDYDLENATYMNRFNTVIYDGMKYEHNYLPGNGLLPSSVPINILSKNQIDVETELFGIGSCNFVSPKQPVLAQMNNLQSLNISNRLPVFLPTPLMINPNERPFRN